MDIKSVIVINNIDNDTPTIKHQVRHSSNLQFENKEGIPLEYRVVIKNGLGEIDWEGRCFNGYLEAWLTVAIETSTEPAILTTPHSMEIHINSDPIVIPLNLNIDLKNLLVFLNKPVNPVIENITTNNLDELQYKTIITGINNISSLLRKLILAFGKDIRESATVIEQPSGHVLSL